MTKCFISHDHKDAKALSKLKEILEGYKIRCFLAHEDIQPGEHDLEAIKKELQGCDCFLLIGNEHSKNSAFVNQEIGYALALNKRIISTIHKGCSPWGFIARQQAIKFEALSDDAFITKLILQFAPVSSFIANKKQALDALGIKEGFRTTREKNHRVNERYKDWTLEVSTWNDLGYYTSCTLNNDYKVVARLSIAHKGFSDACGKGGWVVGESDISDFLPKQFWFLDDNFFSHFLWFADDITEEQKNHLRNLFNDMDTNPKIKEQYKNKEVVRLWFLKREMDGLE